MPVEDHPVHDKVKRDSSFRYGCHNNPKKASGYWAIDRTYRSDGTFFLHNVFIPHTMSIKCRFDMYNNDPQCEGCTVEKDTEYLERMSKL